MTAPDCTCDREDAYECGQDDTGRKCWCSCHDPSMTLDDQLDEMSPEERARYLHDTGPGR